MKTAIFLSLLPLLASGSPVADPEELFARDKWCTLYPGTNNVNCRKGPGTSYGVKRVITSDQRFGVDCVCNGSWDWIPGWSCYVSRTYTNDGCETDVAACSPCPSG